MGGYVRANFRNPSRAWRKVERGFDLEATLPGLGRVRIGRRRLGDACVIDATTGQQICGGTAGTTTAVAAAGTVPCTTGVPRYYPASIQPPTGTTTCTRGMPRYGSSTMQYKPAGAGAARTFNFQYHSGVYDQYSCPNPDGDLVKAGQVNWLVGAGPTWQVGLLPQDESQCGGSTFTFQYHSGANDVYYCQATNQWAITNTGGFQLASMPPAADESQCTGATAATVIPSTVPAGTAVLTYAQPDDSTYESPFASSSAYPSSYPAGYVATSTATPAAPVSSGFLSNIPTWAKYGAAAVAGVLLLKYVGKR